jgi:hypothetical protein
MDHTAVLTAVMPQVKTSRTTGQITIGSQLPKNPFNLSQSSDNFVRIWYASQFDGSVEGAFGTLGTPFWQQYANRMHTGAEQQRGEDKNQLPLLVEEHHGFLLYPGQYITMTVVAAVASSNPITNNWTVNCVWTEEDFSTFTISGVVTLSAVGVVGAEVLVVIADDVAMTNAILWEVVTTTAGGAWSSNIPTGKLAFAYAQNDVSGTKYTSPGRPYQA